MIDITQVVVALIGLLGIILTSVVFPLLKLKLSVEQQSTLYALIRTGVFAAEQLFPAEKGAEKLEYVKNLLREKGYDADTDSVRAAIEAQVKALKIEIGAITVE